MFLNKVKYILLIFSYLLLVTWSCIVCWASNKGFDLSDEGYALYYLNNIGQIKINISLFHFVQNHLFSFVPISIQNLRIERLVLNIITSITLTFSSIYFIQHYFKKALSSISKHFLFVLIYSSFALTYALGSPTPTYNTFSYFLLALCLSLFLIDIAKNQPFRNYTTIYFVMGFFLSFLFLVKVSNAVLFVFFINAYIFVEEAFIEHNLKRAIVKISTRITITLISFFIIQFWIWEGVTNFFTFLTDYKDVLSLVPNHNLNNLFSTYVDSLKYLVEIFVTSPYLLLFFFVLLSFINLYKQSYKLFFLFFICTIYIIVNQKLYLGGTDYLLEQTLVYIIVTSLVILLITFIQLRKKPLSAQDLKQLLFYYFLFIFPLIGILGTSNYPHIQLIFYLSPWLILIYLFISQMEKHFMNYIFLSSLIILSFYISFDSIFNHPYRINEPLLNQTEEFIIDKNDIIYIDKQAKKDLEMIKSILFDNGFKTGDYLFTYSELNGLSYILNAPSPSSNLSWFFSGDEQTNLNILQSFFSKNHLERIFFIIDERSPLSSKFIDYLKLNGYDLNNYNKKEHVQIHLLKEEYAVTFYTPKI